MSSNRFQSYCHQNYEMLVIPPIVYLIALSTYAHLINPHTFMIHDIFNKTKWLRTFFLQSLSITKIDYHSTICKLNWSCKLKQQKMTVHWLIQSHLLEMKVIDISIVIRTTSDDITWSIVNYHYFITCLLFALLYNFESNPMFSL